jgi:transcriptional regulator with XRE-family HTH domain
MRWRKESGISRKLFAQMADCSERTLATYEKSLTLPATGLRTVNETVRLIHALHELAGDDVALTDWLKQPNPAFGKKTPLTLITTGESDVLWEMIHQIRQGSFA